MREIKFRAWNKKDKVMINAIFVGLGKVYGMTKTFKPSKELEDVILMQYTGLLDRNGKQIYEGEVITFQTYNLFAGIVIVGNGKLTYTKTLNY